MTVYRRLPSSHINRTCCSPPNILNSLSNIPLKRTHTHAQIVRAGNTLEIGSVIGKQVDLASCPSAFIGLCGQPLAEQICLGLASNGQVDVQSHAAIQEVSRQCIPPCTALPVALSICGGLQSSGVDVAGATYRTLDIRGDSTCRAAGLCPLLVTRNLGGVQTLCKCA